ncbi:PIN domain-containing protein [Arcticibacter tournemirensis]|uniref:PIN domain-containing protein n=1 Tax=Arcticibacter tournemirensis TaxID=699437 RepID=A0A5M9HFY9_9SPHI|nr:PIN domain-containing protein [Arcticibacter tournemirensis]KAA8485399.1 PIN domain-containing protein [Arcticibacter tournemirensis]TQM50308.1 PIN domain-containing protein [Arcticibacter tournemirensis]
MKIVLDVNILLQSIGRTSLYRPAWAAYLNEEFQLLVSNSMLMEYEEKIAEKTTETVALNVLALIGEAVNTQYITIYYEWNAIR